MKTRLPAVFLALTLFAVPLATLHVTGGITLNGVVQPLLFTWRTPLPFTSTGWAPGESVRVALHGPLDTLGVEPRSVRRVEQRASPPRTLPGGTPFPSSIAAAQIVLGAFTADAQGNFSAAPVIPFTPRIPEPGYYELRATGQTSGVITGAERISLAPATYTGAGTSPIDWGHDRGGRDGILPGDLRQFSPERFDPEWPTVWGERPVAAYGTVVPADADGVNQPSKISPSDNPPTHYAHDAIFFLTPDEPYRWIVGTSNYYDPDPDSPGRGTIEVEWETQNGGSTATYAQGNIGVPLWASPTAGDRVYVVGRWILDAGHPEVGDRTEIHPARLLATMRANPGVGASGGVATQVDIYLSGHGGGANRMPPGLSEVLMEGRAGAGRIEDVLNANDQKTYYQPGPLAPALVPLVLGVIQQITGQTLSLPVFAAAGPTAFPWGGAGPEERTVNDMNYDFDVPLPPAPPGAVSVDTTIVTQPQHTTSVSEIVTFGPASAHVHLPFLGAPNGIYGRTLRFSWKTAPAPAVHATVTLNRINVKDADGKWQLWSDVAGQWNYLSGAAPGLLTAAGGHSISLPGTAQDVYLTAGAKLRVYVQGYRAACLDDYFGKLFGQPSYIAGLTFIAACGPIDNQDLGGAVLELPAPIAPGPYTVTARDSAGASHFTVDLTVALR